MTNHIPPKSHDGFFLISHGLKLEMAILLILSFTSLPSLNLTWPIRDSLYWLSIIERHRLIPEMNLSRVLQRIWFSTCIVSPSLFCHLIKILKSSTGRRFQKETMVLHQLQMALLIPDDSLLHFAQFKNSFYQSKQDLFHLG